MHTYLSCQVCIIMWSYIHHSVHKENMFYLKFCRWVCSSAAESHVKLQSRLTSYHSSLSKSRSKCHTLWDGDNLCTCDLCDFTVLCMDSCTILFFSRLNLGWFQLPLTHWGWDETAAIAQTTLSDPFSWMFEFRLKFHWSWFPRVLLTIFQHWVR